MFQETKAKRGPMQIIGIVVIFILAVLIILTFVIFGMFRDSGTAPKLFGYRVYVVPNDRMEPRIPKGSAVFVEEGATPNPQSVILCSISDELYVIGFVGTETAENGEVSYIVKYDNATDDRTWGISESDIIGVAQTYDSFLGWVIRFASSKAGMMTIVIVPCLLVIIYEVLMLVLSRKNADSDIKWREDSAETSKSKPARKIEPVRRAAEEKPSLGGIEEPIRKAEEPIRRAEDDLSAAAEAAEKAAEAAKEDRFFEKQLRKANDKLNSTVLESTGVIEAAEIDLGPLEVKPDEKPIAPVGFTPREEKPAEKPAESSASSVIGDLSASRIDELIKLLEEEKKRLEDQSK